MTEKMYNGYNPKPTEDEIKNNMQEAIDGLRAENKDLYKHLEEAKLKYNKLEKQNQELIMLAFPEATKHLKAMISSIAKTIKESVNNG